MKFKLGDRVRKIRGSSWQGIVVGTYATELTPEGYAVESKRERGSVQIYPAQALELVGDTSMTHHPTEGWEDWEETLREFAVHEFTRTDLPDDYIEKILSYVRANFTPTATLREKIDSIKKAFDGCVLADHDRSYLAALDDILTLLDK